MAFQLREVGYDFVDTAPQVLRYTAHLDAPATVIFNELSGNPANWRHWFPGFRDGAYDSPPPHGVGSLRRVNVLGAGTYHETIMAWDEPREWAWRVDRTTAPLARALVERWTLAPAGDQTEVTWTFAVDPMPWFGFSLRLAPFVMQRVFRSAMRRLEQRVTQPERPRPPSLPARG